MPDMARVTVSLPADLVERIDQVAENRSQFLVEAARAELDRRRRAALRESLEHPHADSAGVAAEGFDAWAVALGTGDAEGLLVADGGVAVGWVDGEGWRAQTAPTGRSARRRR